MTSSPQSDGLNSVRFHKYLVGRGISVVRAEISEKSFRDLYIDESLPIRPESYRYSRSWAE